MKLEDEGCNPGTDFDSEAETMFNRYYLANLSGSPSFVCLESEHFFFSIHMRLNFCPVGMHKHDQRCTDLIEVTANALSAGVVALMLLAVQRDNLELSVKQAIIR